MTREEAINKLHGLIYGVVDRQRIDDTCREVIHYLRAQDEKCRACGEKTNNVIQALQAELKSQEPRVMTLDELSEKTDVWFESLVYDTIDPALSSGSYGDGTVGLMTIEDELFYMYEADYGTKWRCWTSRPDQATREATPWN